MKPLRVRKERIRSPQRVTELAFEEDVVQRLGGRPIKADGIGMPDSYLGRGRWIEFKSDVFDRGIALYNRLEPQQRARVRELVRLGDRVWIVTILVDMQTGKEWVLAQSWRAFEHTWRGVPKLGRQELIALCTTREYFMDRVLFRIAYGD